MQLPAFLSRRRFSPLTAVVPAADGLSLAMIDFDGAKPGIEFCEFIPWATPAERVQVLTQAASKHKLHKQQCVTVMNYGDYNILSVEAPEVPALELKAAIRWRIKDLIDFHIDDAIIDIFNAPVSGVPGRQNNLYVVVARQSVVREKVDLLQAEHVNLGIVDVPELALKNIAGYLPYNETGVVLIHLEAEQGLIIIVKDSSLYLARTMDLGYRQLQEVQATLDAGGGVHALDRLVLEVQRSLDYYDRYFLQPQVSSLVLAPMPPNANPVAAMLQENLGIPCELLDLNELFHCATPLDPRLQSHSLLAIGAALRRESAAL